MEKPKRKTEFSFMGNMKMTLNLKKTSHSGTTTDLKMDLQKGLPSPQLRKRHVIFNGLFHLLVSSWPGVLYWHGPFVVPGAVS